MRLGSVLYALLTLVLMAGVGFAFLVYTPGTPLPPEWNPRKPLDVTAPVTLVTKAKLKRALSYGPACLTALSTGARYRAMEDLMVSPECGIENRVEITALGDTKMQPVETRCQTALRLAMWYHHGVKPAAETFLGEKIAELRHKSSYNCRQMRTTNGTERMSTHATAESIDISGVILADGRALNLYEGWTAGDTRAAFFRRIRDDACTWFRVTLSPDYNQLHADHFHLQHTGWGLCR